MAVRSGEPRRKPRKPAQYANQIFVAFFAHQIKGALTPIAVAALEERQSSEARNARSAFGERTKQMKKFIKLVALAGMALAIQAGGNSSRNCYQRPYYCQPKQWTPRPCYRYSQPPCYYRAPLGYGFRIQPGFVPQPCAPRAYWRRR